MVVDTPSEVEAHLAVLEERFYSLQRTAEGGDTTLPSDSNTMPAVSNAKALAADLRWKLELFFGGRTERPRRALPTRLGMITQLISARCNFGDGAPQRSRRRQ